MFDAYDKYLLAKKEKGQLRTLSSDTMENALDFTHNDYLGLSHHPLLLERGMDYAKAYGIGGKASRVLSNYNPIYNALEAKIAKTYNKEEALIFPSGYQTNQSLLATLLDPKVLKKEPLVYSDRLNHASIHQGCKLAGIRQIRYRHCDMQHLEQLLQQDMALDRPRFILTETLFSMEGDYAPLEALVRLATHYNAFLYIDEAHAMGVTGRDGFGCAASIRASNTIDVIMGSFSKALGVCGGFIACSAALKDYIINSCPGFIYTTALPFFVIGAIDAAWDILPTLEDQRIALRGNSQYLRAALHQKNYSTFNTTSHIIPILCHTEKAVMEKARFLKENNMLVSAIRPPTVPIHSSRLRVVLNTTHSRHDIDRLIGVL